MKPGKENDMNCRYDVSGGFGVVLLAAMASLCFLFIGTGAHAADLYMAVGGTGANVYFEPTAGDAAVFPNGHTAAFAVCNLAEVAFNPQSNAPVSLNPVTGLAGNSQLPSTGALAVTPTTDQAKADECKILIHFNLDRVTKGQPAEWITEDKLVAVGCVISSVVRVAGQPKSVRPGGEYAVMATITPPLTGSGHNVQFTVTGGSGDNGTATITANMPRQTSGPVTVKGGDQTAVGHAGGLKIQAALDGTALCGESNGFSVCAHPNAVLSGPVHAPINTTYAGMEINITIRSDSGTDTDLDQVMDSEHVPQSNGATGSGENGLTAETGGYQQATTVPPDQHVVAKTYIIDRFDNHGGAGSMNFDQVDSFYCKRCGMQEANAVVIPNSGHTVTFSWWTTGGNSILMKAKKVAHACTVGAFTSAAGPSTDHEETVTVR